MTDAKELAERLRQRVRRRRRAWAAEALDSTELLADAVEQWKCEQPPTPTSTCGECSRCDWLSRVVAATEGEDDGS